MLPRQYSHYIFDLDGTIATILIDWRDWHPGMIDIIQKYEPQFQPIPYVSHPLTNEYMAKYGPDLIKDVQSFTANYEITHFKGIKENKKVIDLIKNISPDKFCHLLTSNCREIADRVLKLTNLETMFRQIITRDDLDLIKPNEYAITKINPENIPLREFLMVGDTSSDSEFAKNAHIAYLDVTEI